MASTRLLRLSLKGKHIENESDYEDISTVLPVNLPFEVDPEKTEKFLNQPSNKIDMSKYRPFFDKINMASHDDGLTQ